VGYKKISYSGGITAGQFYNCYTSKYHYIEINYAGKVYKCTARDYQEFYERVELKEKGSESVCGVINLERSMRERIVDLYESSIKAVKQNAVT
jgi:hypothetical protein